MFEQKIFLMSMSDLRIEKARTFFGLTTGSRKMKMEKGGGGGGGGGGGRRGRGREKREGRGGTHLLNAWAFFSIEVWMKQELRCPIARPANLLQGATCTHKEQFHHTLIGIGSQDAKS